MIGFDCADCGVQVYGVRAGRAGGPGQRCGHCQWLADIPDPVEREQLRARLIEAGSLMAEPGYWMNEVSGKLRPVIEAYLHDEPMTGEQIAIMRAYLRQWIGSDVWDWNTGAEGRAWLAGMRLACDALLSREAIELWIDRAIDAGLDPI
jgi:hypothetical protein